MLLADFECDFTLQIGISGQEDRPEASLAQHAEEVRNGPNDRGRSISAYVGCSFSGSTSAVGGRACCCSFCGLKIED